MAGLVELAMKDPLKTSANGTDTYQMASTTGVDPVTRAVSPEETVAGQVDKLYKAEGPLITQARTNAAQEANRRGLINSTMAVTAGEDAALRSVLPIASQDAQTYTVAASENMTAKNNAAGFNASSSNATAATNAGALNAAARTKQQGDIQTGQIITQGEQSRLTQAQNIQGQKELTAMAGEVNKMLQTLKGDQATALTNIEANYKQLIQASTAAASAYSTAIPMLAAIMANTDTTPEQKQQGVDRITQLLEANLATVGAIANVDIAGLVDFT